MIKENFIFEVSTLFLMMETMNLLNFHPHKIHPYYLCQHIRIYYTPLNNLIRFLRYVFILPSSYFPALLESAVENPNTIEILSLAHPSK